MENSSSLQSVEKFNLKELFSAIKQNQKDIIRCLIGATLIIIAVYGLTHK
jgi:hypothetical protein